MDSVTQKTLRTNYQLLFGLHCPQPSFRDVGFRVFSEHDEDGIILFIFSMIQPRTYRCLELGAGNCLECNTTNLIVNHRWTGILIDASQSNVDQGIKFFARNTETKIYPPKVVRTWITRSTISSVLTQFGMEGEIDLLSIDLDGIDYWIWKSLDCVRPRVVVLEFNQILGAHKSVTVPYRDDFVISSDGNYFGASLHAFVKLGRTKGYRLVGTNSIGTNAFFVNEDDRHPWLMAVDHASCLDHPRAAHSQRTRFSSICNKPWEEV